MAIGELFFVDEVVGDEGGIAVDVGVVGALATGAIDVVVASALATVSCTIGSLGVAGPFGTGS